MPRNKIHVLEWILRLDRLPQRVRTQEKFRQQFRAIGEFYGFEPIVPSILEEPKRFAPLLKAGLLGERLPVFCRTRDGAEVLLRLSGVLSVLRAYISHTMNDLPHPLKFFFEGESFFLLRRRSVAGEEERGVTHREGIAARQEWGLVMIGEEGPVAEAEIIQAVWKAFEAGGCPMEHAGVTVNATGCVTCRSSFRGAFTAYFRSRVARLCRDCKKHLKRIQTRILRCEEEKCRAVIAGAPQVLDFLCETCKKHLRGFLEFLEEVRIPYLLNPKFFRDDSWYDSFLFEFTWRGSPAGEGKDSPERPLVLAEGGRISRAGELLWGRRLDAVGATILLDQVEKMCMASADSSAEGKTGVRVFVAHLGDLAKRKSLTLLEMLRANGIEARESLGRDSIKSQLKIAERVGAETALIMGQKEALDGTIIVREVQSGIQETLPQEKLIEFLKKKLEKE